MLWWRGPCVTPNFGILSFVIMHKCDWCFTATMKCWWLVSHYILCAVQDGHCKHPHWAVWCALGLSLICTDSHKNSGQCFGVQKAKGIVVTCSDSQGHSGKFWGVLTGKGTLVPIWVFWKPRDSGNCLGVLKAKGERSLFSCPDSQRNSGHIWDVLTTKGALITVWVFWHKSKKSRT